MTVENLICCLVFLRVSCSMSMYILQFGWVLLKFIVLHRGRSWEFCDKLTMLLNQESTSVSPMCTSCIHAEFRCNNIDSAHHRNRWQREMNGPRLLNVRFNQQLICHQTNDLSQQLRRSTALHKSPSHAKLKTASSILMDILALKGMRDGKPRLLSIRDKIFPQFLHDQAQTKTKLFRVGGGPIRKSDLGHITPRSQIRQSPTLPLVPFPQRP